jgi:hypothetical protein
MRAAKRLPNFHTFFVWEIQCVSWFDVKCSVKLGHITNRPISAKLSWRVRVGIDLAFQCFITIFSGPYLTEAKKNTLLTVETL